MWTEEGYQTKFVFRYWGNFVLGLLVLLGAVPGFLVLMLHEYLAGDSQILWALVILPVFALLGIWLLGWVTRITLNQYPEEYMTVTREHIPFFLRSLRVKRVSKGEAKTVRTRSEGRSNDAWYLVEVIMASGKPLKLYRDIFSTQAEDIARTIRRWSGVKPDGSPEAKVSWVRSMVGKQPTRMNVAPRAEASGPV